MKQFEDNVAAVNAKLEDDDLWESQIQGNSELENEIEELQKALTPIRKKISLDRRLKKIK